ncbi:MAG: hypothetical protein IKZ62_10945 [Prevotella sp.]|nr:hypothetical protein [Prevotella sp.]
MKWFYRAWNRYSLSRPTRQQLLLMMAQSSLTMTGDNGRMALSRATHSSRCCHECGEPPRRKLTKAVKRPLSPLDNEP